MKIRIGFVTNSSSSSYLTIRAENPLLQEILEKYDSKGVLEHAWPLAQYVLREDGFDSHHYSKRAINFSEDRTQDWDLLFSAPGGWAIDPNVVERELYEYLQDQLEETIRKADDVNQRELEKLLIELGGNEQAIIDSFDSIVISNVLDYREYGTFTAGEEVEFEYTSDKKSGSIRWVSTVQNSYDEDNEDEMRDARESFQYRRYRFMDPVFRFWYWYDLTSSAGDANADDTICSGMTLVNGTNQEGETGNRYEDSRYNPGFAFWPAGYRRSPFLVIFDEPYPFMSSFPHFIEIDTGGSWKHEGQSISELSAVMDSNDFERLIQESCGRGALLYLTDNDGTASEPVYNALEKIMGDRSDHRLGPIIPFDEGPLLYYEPNYFLYHSLPGGTEQNKVNLPMAPYCQPLFFLDEESIEEAIHILQEHLVPDSVDRFHFFLSPPKENKTRPLTFDHPHVITFFKLLKQEHNFAITVNAHANPVIHKYYKIIVPGVLEPCEGGRFSAYISPDMKLHPCKHCLDDRYAVSLRGLSIKEAWNSDVFQQFREVIRENCPDDVPVDNLTCGCPLMCKGL